MGSARAHRDFASAGQRSTGHVGCMPFPYSAHSFGGGGAVVERSFSRQSSVLATWLPLVRALIDHFLAPALGFLKLLDNLPTLCRRFPRQWQIGTKIICIQSRV